MGDSLPATVLSPSSVQNQLVLEQYLEILEKTNQQLSIWLNPYGLMIGILTLIVAVGAIIVGIILWKNSKEQKEQTKLFFAGQREIIEERNNEAKKKLDEMEKKFDELIREYEKQLNSATKEGKEKIQEIIGDLKRERATLGAYLGPGTSNIYATPFSASVNSLFGSELSKEMVCTNCGKSFKYKESVGVGLTNIGGVASVSFGEKKVFCVHCGTANIPQG